MRGKFVVGNWKMNGGLAANAVLLSELAAGWKAEPGRQIAVCAPCRAGSSTPETTRRRIDLRCKRRSPTELRFSSAILRCLMVQTVGRRTFALTAPTLWAAHEWNGQSGESGDFKEGLPLTNSLAPRLEA